MEWHGQAAGKSSNRDADMAINDIERNLNKIFANVGQQIHRVDQMVGESFVRSARQNDTYKDQTANLRNSIGYSAISPQQRSESANSDAKEAISEVEGEVQDTGLIMVAGMKYGSAVEAKGYDVISNSVVQAKEQYARLIVKALEI